jgi:hypothetical protein
MCQDQIKNGKYHQILKQQKKLNVIHLQQSMDKYQEFLHQVQLQPNVEVR